VKLQFAFTVLFQEQDFCSWFLRNTGQNPEYKILSRLEKQVCIKWSEALRRIINNSPAEFRFENLFVFNACVNTFTLEQNMVLI